MSIEGKESERTAYPLLEKSINLGFNLAGPIIVFLAGVDLGQGHIEGAVIKAGGAIFWITVSIINNLQHPFKLPFNR